MKTHNTAPITSRFAGWMTVVFVLFISVSAFSAWNVDADFTISDEATIVAVDTIPSFIKAKKIGDDFSLSPNPASDALLLDLTAFLGDPIEMMLMDHRGMVVWFEETGNLIQSPKFLDLIELNLVSGAHYFVIRRPNGEVSVQEVMVEVDVLE
jgi:hypothetical protein